MGRTTLADKADIIKDINFYSLQYELGISQKQEAQSSKAQR